MTTELTASDILRAGAPLGNHNAEKTHSGHDLTQTDPEYAAAHRAFNKVSQDHTRVTRDYRLRKVGDAEFLASRKRLNDAQKAFDEAERRAIAKNTP